MRIPAMVAAAALALSANPIDFTLNQAAAEAAVTAETKIAAVLIRADWCASCKVLEPKWNEVKADGAVEGLEHITLDFTKRNQNALFNAADAAGVGYAVRREFAADGVVTGIVLLVDVDDKKIVADLRKELSTDELREVVTRKLAEA